MTTRVRHLSLLSSLAAIGALVVCFVVGGEVYQAARADAAAEVMAGSGSAALHDPAVDPGPFVGDEFSALQAGEWGLLAVGLLLAIDELLLWRARRAGSRLAPLVPYLAALSAVCLTAATALVTSGGAKSLKAAAVAVVFAGLTYYLPRSRRDGGIGTSPSSDAPTAPPPEPPSQPTLPLVALVALVLAVVTVAGCGPLRRTGNAVGDDLLQCGKAEVASAAGDLLVDVRGILEHGTGAWRDELDAIEAQGKAHGGAALICAVQAAVDDLMSATRAGGIATSPGAAAAERGRAFLRARGLTLPIRKED